MDLYHFICMKTYLGKKQAQRSAPKPNHQWIVSRFRSFKLATNSPKWKQVMNCHESTVEITKIGKLLDASDVNKF